MGVSTQIQILYCSPTQHTFYFMHEWRVNEFIPLRPKIAFHTSPDTPFASFGGGGRERMRCNYILMCLRYEKSRGEGWIHSILVGRMRWCIMSFIMFPFHDVNITCIMHCCPSRVKVIMILFYCHRWLYVAFICRDVIFLYINYCLCNSLTFLQSSWNWDLFSIDNHSHLSKPKLEALLD